MKVDIERLYSKGMRYLTVEPSQGFNMVRLYKKYPSSNAFSDTWFSVGNSGLNVLRPGRVYVLDYDKDRELIDLEFLI